MKRHVAVFLISVACSCGTASAQSDTLPSSGSTAGVTILGTGRSLSPANLTPTGPRTPVGFPPAWQQEKAPMAPVEPRRKRY